MMMIYQEERADIQLYKLGHPTIRIWNLCPGKVVVVQLAMRMPEINDKSVLGYKNKN